MPLSEKFRKIIIANELGGDLDEALKFSDPDGVRSGKSGWSFGVCQFDLQNNSLAAGCLRECGFTQEEIDGLTAQTLTDREVRELEPRLRAAAGVVARYDEAQLGKCVDRAQYACKRFGLVPADDAAILSMADYDNQYGLSLVAEPHTLIGALVELAGPFTAETVLNFKLYNTKWGRENPKDVRRRYDNIINITKEA